MGYLSVARLGPRLVPAGWPPASELAEYTAVFHVHSGASHDARGSIEDVARAAERAGARVLFLTEHNDLGPLDYGTEGWHGSTLVLVGAEISTHDGYVVLLNPYRAIPSPARRKGLRDVIALQRAEGGIAVLPHPSHPRLSWQGKTGFVDGVEVVDLLDEFVAAPLSRLLVALLAYPANPGMAILSLVDRPRDAIARWEALAREHPTVGVLGLDAHGGVELTEQIFVGIPSHETLFRLGQLHFVTHTPLAHDPDDVRRVASAFRAGRFYNAFDGFAPAAGFRFEAVRDGERSLMGDSVPLRGATEGVLLEVRVPPAGETVVRVLHDGAVIHEGSGDGGVRLAVAEPGAYRVEVDLRVDLFPLASRRFVPWIFSNAIYVRP